MDKTKKTNDENMPKEQSRQDSTASSHQRIIDVTLVEVHRERRDGFAPRRRQTHSQDQDNSSGQSNHDDRGGRGEIGRAHL